MSSAYLFVKKVMFPSDKNILKYKDFLSTKYASPGRGIDDFSMNAQILLDNTLSNIKNFLGLTHDQEIILMPTNPERVISLINKQCNFKIYALEKKLINKNICNIISQDNLDIFIINANHLVLGSCLSIIICHKNILSKIDHPFLGGGMVNDVSKNKEFCIKKSSEGFWAGTWPVIQICLLKDALEDLLQ